VGTAPKPFEALLDRLQAIAGGPTSADRAEFYSRWDYAQTNDLAIADADPWRDEVTAAIGLSDGDPQAGFRSLLDLAERDSVGSMNHVAWCYTNARGVEGDDAEAEEWRKRAMEAGSLEALLACGRYSWQRGDLDACEATYGVGAAMGWAPAQYWLAMSRYRRVRSRATLAQIRPLLESAAAKGSPAAQEFLVTCLIWGRAGLREIPRGIRLFFTLSRREFTDFEVKQQAASRPA
jgi:TPR repeat protein